MPAITPSDFHAKQKVIPEEIIEVVNAMLLEAKQKYNGGSITLKQDDIMARIINDTQFKDRHEVFENHYMDFEHVFRAAGWGVRYDKPAYNESYDAYFEFTPN